MLVSNLLSSIDEDHYLRLLISNNDLRLLMSHFVNYLLNIGIVCPLDDGCDKFMVCILLLQDLMFFLYNPLIFPRWIVCIDGVALTSAIKDLLDPKENTFQCRSIWQLSNR